jgi:predicted metal-dependent hydrolase
MSTGSSCLTVRGIEVAVVYKDVKNLHISVYPPAGRVRVAAPECFDDERVRLAIVQRLAWIKRQQAQLRNVTRQSEREMVTGESHYVWGTRHRLKVVERPGRAHVELDGERLLLYVPPGTDADDRRRLLDRWYRAQLRTAIPALVATWEPTLGVSVPRWGIRRMKTRWGSCNRETGHIWLNLELAKKHPLCLEYVVVHEMAHLLERTHGPRFTHLMDRFLPEWRSRRAELDGAPLADERWQAR